MKNHSLLDGSAAMTARPAVSGVVRRNSHHAPFCGGQFRPRQLLPVLALVWLAVTQSALAHVRWFVDNTGEQARHQFAVDPTTILIVLGALAFVGLACFIETAGWTRRLESRFVAWYLFPRGTEWRIVGFLAGLMLIANATMRVFLAPNLEIHNPAMVLFGMIAQCLVGLLLVSQFTFLISGVLVLLVIPLAAAFVPFSALLNYLFEFAALGAALILVGPGLSPVDRRIAQSLRWNFERVAAWPLPIIRIGVGVTLMILAFDEKLLHPGLALAFLQEHHFNFMPQLGFAGFTDLHFVFAAGVAELTFGALLTAGIATRFVTGVLSGFFVATLLALGPIELVGHAPLFGIALLLVVQGGGAWRLALRPAAPPAEPPATDMKAFAPLRAKS